MPAQRQRHGPAAGKKSKPKGRVYSLVSSPQHHPLFDLAAVLSGTSPKTAVKPAQPMKYSPKPVVPPHKTAVRIPSKRTAPARTRPEGMAHKPLRLFPTARSRLPKKR
ncbi:MAG: hypothetical protein IPJ89_02675 [Candidatus Iainarchaeum archaeon]|uniref:Uncharacterized protein n=1 Tax=Candidatus Iainarchaeum sp. TaxID=3101447 RepID=A0A7T9DKR4_9ARCH|nr:MAG: hypothetical protein IPJ89_02675 [Candidatus Diapherotrites archaeon]